MDRERVKQAYQTGVRSKGFDIQTTATGANERLDLSGFGGELLGIALLTDVDGGFGANTRISLKVNNDLIIDEVDARFLEDSPDNPRPFVAYPRPLTGQDSINIEIANNSQQTVTVILYYRQQEAQRI